MNPLTIPEIQSALVALLAAVLTLCTALVTSVAVPWIKRHGAAAQLDLAASIASTAVGAAEQTYGLADDTAKLAFAMSFLHDHAAWLPAPLARALIENALVDLKVSTGDLPIGKPAATPPSILTPGTTAPGEAAPLATSAASPAPPVPMPTPPPVPPDVPPPASSPAP